MDRQQLRRTLVILLALTFLVIGIATVFALAAHSLCSAKSCGLCLSLAKLRETLRVFEAPMGLFAPLILLLLATGELLNRPMTSNLVLLKARLNN